MKKQNLKHLFFLGLLFSFSFYSCDVKQTKETKLPDVAIDVDAGQLPQFNVDWVDVDVSTRTETVKVPTLKVVMEEMEVEVPYVDVDMPNASKKEELTIAVEAEISSKTHSLEIVEVYATQKRLYVISQLKSTGKDLKGERMRIADRIILNASDDLDIKHYIIGNRLPGQFNKQYSYIRSKTAIANKLKNGKFIYKK